MRYRRRQGGFAATQVVMVAVIAVAVVLVLWFLFRDQGKDDNKNEPGLVNPIALIS